MNIRLLTEQDAAALRDLRLRSLKAHPEAFGASYEEELSLTVADWAKRVREGLPHAVNFGAFTPANELVGMVNLNRYLRQKISHRGTVNAMYVDPEGRGQGLGKALLEALIDYALTLEGLQDLTLAVTVGNFAARQLYRGLGFITYGVEPRLIRLNDQYFDVEWMLLSLANVRTQKENQL